jgi:hypothetical protein
MRYVWGSPQFTTRLATFSVALLAIVLGQVFLKPVLIFSPQPVLDDITYHQYTLYYDQWYPRPDVMVFNYLSHYWGIEYAKISYLVIFGVAAGCWALVLLALTQSPIFSVLLTVAALQSEYTFIYPFFIIGSYGLLFLPLLSVSILLMMRLTGTNGSLPEGRRYWAFVAGSAAAALAASALSPNAVLVPLVIMLALAYLAYSEKGLRAGPLAGLLVATVAFYAYVYLTFDHPYVSMQGRTTREPFEIAKNGLSILYQTVRAAFEARVYTGRRIANADYGWGIVVAIGLCVLLFAVWAWRQDRKTTTFGVLCAGLIGASIVPLSPLTVSHLWHFFLHGTLIITIVALMLRSISAPVGYAFVIVMMAFGIRTNIQSLPIYNDGMRQQEELASFFRRIGPTWPDSANVKVYTDRRGLSVNGLNGGRADSLFTLESKGRRLPVTVRVAAKSQIEVVGGQITYAWYGEVAEPQRVGGP